MIQPIIDYFWPAVAALVVFAVMWLRDDSAALVIALIAGLVWLLTL